MPAGLKQTCFVSRYWRLEVQNQGIHRDMLPLEALEKNPSLLLLSFCWLPGIAGVPWPQLHHPTLCLPPHGAFFPVGVSGYPAFLRGYVIGFRAYSEPVGPHLNLLTSAETLLPNEVTFTGAGAGTRMYLFEGYDSSCHSLHPTASKEWRLSNDPISEPGSGFSSPSQTFR